MFLLIRFAYRNLVRHPKRTFVAALAMSMGLTISFWLDCTLSGRNAEVIKYVTSAYTGNFQIYHKNFLDEKLITQTAGFDLSVLEEKFSTELHASSRIHLPSLISSGENSFPVLVQGIHPGKEKNVSTVVQSIRSGENLGLDSTCSPGEVLISEKISKMLQVGLGEKLVLLTQTTDGNLGNDLFRVKGIFNTGAPNFDKGYIFVTNNCAKELGAVSRPHEIVMTLKEGADEKVVFAKLKALVTGHDVLTTWEQAIPNVANMIQLNNGVMGMVSVIVLVVVILGFVNTLLMSVFERTKEIGMMLSVGFSPKQVRLLLVFESLIIGFCSSLLAIILGSVIVFYHTKYGFDLRPFLGENFNTNMYTFSFLIFPTFSLFAFLKVIILSLVIVVIAVLFPAYKASKLSPLEVQRG